ncbi:MarR family transcriptional regulator [Actinomadura sp. DC4]|uniref:MarR family winged helix-turn-helix transcriptional regulator n=1 Tax=Actinomadura sp. DC4 TaxID=3055069 RepID=UPI0025AF1858|nr:MarR family transcriptional regulator [Actinomadura sp. DC4]MDN3355524.1 MarR family transcriptional regulator [Actinomadura sp. DC4]
MTRQEVALLVKRLQHRHHRELTAALAPLGVSLPQWDTLRHLGRNPGASLHDLAQLTFQTDQSFGSLAARMAERGLIERVPGPGRAVRHRLTEKGEELWKAGDVLAGKVMDESLGALTADQVDQLGALLGRVLAQSSGES